MPFRGKLQSTPCQPNPRQPTDQTRSRQPTFHATPGRGNLQTRPGPPSAIYNPDQAKPRRGNLQTRPSPPSAIYNPDQAKPRRGNLLPTPIYSGANCNPCRSTTCQDNLHSAPYRAVATYGPGLAEAIYNPFLTFPGQKTFQTSPFRTTPGPHAYHTFSKEKGGVNDDE
ncbi:MAG: hypothetical protein PHI12_11070 [Dehalococcoidales bacterium]|nr:hypothetical protein [Dehalococcoidales bacterium]